MCVCMYVCMYVNACVRITNEPVCVVGTDLMDFMCVTNVCMIV